jgi:hypothetical protein
VRADGREFRELRHPEDVFRADSIASLNLAPLTDRHPSELVTPANVRDLQVGIVTNPRHDSRFVQADLVVQDQRMIQKVSRGDARELSGGYTIDLEMKPGVFDGERYDGRQRNITFNHTGIGPGGWGRSGSEVRVHLDSLGDLRETAAYERWDGADLYHEDQREMVPDPSMSEDQLREARDLRSMRFGIRVTEGSNLTWPEGGPQSLDEYADPVNLEFPLQPDSAAIEARVQFRRLAATFYSDDFERARVHARIVERLLRISAKPTINLDDPLDRLLPRDLRERALAARRGDGGSPRRQQMDMKIVRIDGLDHEMSKNAAAATEKAIADRDAKIAELTSRADKAEGERDGLKTKATELQTKLDEASSPERVATAVKARHALEIAAGKVMGPAENDGNRFDGKTDREVVLMAITHHDSKFVSEGKSDDYLQARFDMLVDSAPERRDARGSTLRAIHGAQGRQDGTTRQDGTPPISSAADAAKQANRDAMARASKPLRVSTGNR